MVETGTVESMFVGSYGQFRKCGATVEMVLRRQAEKGKVDGVDGESARDANERKQGLTTIGFKSRTLA